jgi:hypothetical protein
MSSLRQAVLAPFTVLMVILVLMSAGTVALLVRMAPAIERIISENLFSLEAAEEMTLAICEGGTVPDARARFDRGLGRARGNITEANEQRLLATLGERGPVALAGDLAARREALAALSELGHANRTAVVREDNNAKQVGLAGAWAAVFLGALSFAWALTAVKRTRRRVIDPLNEVVHVLDAVHTGDRYRRCKRIPAPAELSKIMNGVDELLDARALTTFAAQPSLRATVDRQIVVQLLEQRDGPVWVLTADGSVDAANGAALAALHADDSGDLRRALNAAASGTVAGHLRVTKVSGAERFVCELVASPPPPPEPTISGTPA